jgi:predicted dehydrogenase
VADKIRYGVLSTAQIARNQHIPSAQKSSNSEVIAISSRDEARAKTWAAALNIPKAYGAYEALLADPEVDAVINPLPNSLHCQWTIKAAEAGKHILCEKPLAVTVEQAQRMIDAARANEVRLMEGFTHRFNPLFSFILATIEAGAIGEIRFVRSELTYTLQDWENDTRVKAHLAGGGLFDAGCYAVNTVRTLMQTEPESVQAVEHIRESHQVDTRFVGLLKFPGGRLATITAGMESPFRFSCEVIGSTGSLITENLFRADRLHVMTDKGEWVEEFEVIDRFQAQIEHFSDCILQNRRPAFSPEDGRSNVAVLVALKQAARTGKVVKINQ